MPSASPRASIYLWFRAFIIFPPVVSNILLFKWIEIWICPALRARLPLQELGKTWASNFAQGSRYPKASCPRLVQICHDSTCASFLSNLGQICDKHIWPRLLAEVLQQSYPAYHTRVILLQDLLLYKYCPRFAQSCVTRVVPTKVKKRPRGELIWIRFTFGACFSKFQIF